MNSAVSKIEPPLDCNDISPIGATAPAHYELTSAPKPKPSSTAIKAMLAQYYNKLSIDFDEFNSTVSFGAYLSAINELVARHLRSHRQVSTLLSVGSGTGRRELAIRESSKLDFAVTCVDTSPEMCKIAGKHGLEALCGSLADLEFPAASFDACIFLNAFEVLTDRNERKSCLEAIYRCLKPGGLFFVDAMDIENRNDAWAESVKRQFHDAALGEAGYELGDCFCRRVDQDLIVFAHYSSYDEMHQLLNESEFEIKSLAYVSESTGEICGAGEGHMFFCCTTKVESRHS